MALDNTWDKWAITGLTRYAFGETADDTLLKTYYNQAEDINILSLFPAYFIEEFASEEEMQIVRETALSLASYVIENSGLSFYIENGVNSFKQEWLNALGVDRAYSEPYDGLLENYRYSKNDKYPLIVTTDRRDVFYLHSLRGLRTSPEIMRLFYEAKEGTQAYINAVSEQAPEYLDYILDNFSQPIYYYFEEGSSSYTKTYARTVKLGRVVAFLHETVHIMIPTLSTDDRWKYEAMAGYLPITFFRHSLFDNNLNSFLYDVIDDAIEGEGFSEYTELARSYYNKHITDDVSGNEFALFIKSEAYAQTFYEVDSLPWITSISEAHKLIFDTELNYIKKSNGGELTYDQAYCFADYLINKYSFSTFIGYCLPDVSFEEAFGMSYEQAKAEWLEEYF